MKATEKSIARVLPTASRYKVNSIETMPIDDAAKKRITEFARQYRRFARIHVEIVSFDGQRLIVRVEQKEAVNGQFLTKKELVDRVREMFAGEIPAEWKLSVSAVNFDRQEIEGIDAEWIAKRMDALGLKQKHLATYTGIDKTTISKLVAGKVEPSGWCKVAMYYFFKSYETSGFGKSVAEA
jgi:DNA-binding XRE family transcriptional regulator